VASSCAGRVRPTVCVGQPKERVAALALAMRWAHGVHRCIHSAHTLRTPPEQASSIIRGELLWWPRRDAVQLSAWHSRGGMRAVQVTGDSADGPSARLRC
jgi:hypothetical protein